MRTFVFLWNLDLMSNQTWPIIQSKQALVSTGAQQQRVAPTTLGHLTGGVHSFFSLQVSSLGGAAFRKTR